jgi:hypothetical protein
MLQHWVKYVVEVDVVGYLVPSTHSTLVVGEG